MNQKIFENLLLISMRRRSKKQNSNFKKTVDRKNRGSPNILILAEKIERCLCGVHETYFLNF